jgi:hypothetical protein
VGPCTVDVSQEPPDHQITQDPETFDEHVEGPFDLVAMQRLLSLSDTIQGFLDEFTRRAAVETGHHCSITLDRRGDDPYTVASSDGMTLELDELQYGNGDGPCLEAMRTSSPVIVVDFSRESRFGDYPAHAFRVGARSSMSYPLVSVGPSMRGVLNLYAETPLDPGPELRGRVQALAYSGSGVVALAQRLAGQQELIGNLRLALRSRTAIDQAIGVLMGQQRCDAPAAFKLLVQSSRNRNVKLRDVAAGILASVQRGDPGSPGARY